MISPGSIAEQVSGALERGAVVLTSNERAARTLRQRMAWQLQSPQQILSLSAWTAAEWQRRVVDGTEERVTLSTSQERRLWDEVIRSDKALRTLLAHDSIADLAMGAGALLGRWDARALLKLHAGSSDVSSFHRWLEKVERLCTMNSWLLPEQMTAALAGSIRQTPIEGSPSFLLVGFDELLPSQQRLIDALRDTGASVVKSEPASQQATLKLAATETLMNELALCAQWAGRRVDDGQRVAIIHANPEDVRPHLERALRLHADPTSNDIAHASAREAFEFSLGVPLSSVALIHHVLLLLQMVSGTLDLQSASELIRSRYLFSAATLMLRAEFDAYALRQDQALRAEVTIGVIVTLMLEVKHGRAIWQQLHPLAHALQHASRLPRGPRHRGWEEWAELVREVLRAVQLSAHSGETSFEFQIRRRWEELLDEFARLQVIDREVDWETAFATLKRMCAETMFAPESHDAPIQVMSPAEAAGSEFDAIWILGADDSSWPAPSTTHPLLPFSLQREADMPGATWQRSRERTAAIICRLLRSAPDAVVSYAKSTPTGEHARLSRLFEHYAPAPLDFLPEGEQQSVSLVSSRQHDALPTLPEMTLPGGARVLELQAACPFRAFAEARLFSSPPGETTDGMNAGVRGVALHKVLEDFWLAVASRKGLADISMPDATTGITRRDTLLAEIVDNVLARPGASEWEQQYLELERERILTLANRWLDYELSRNEDFSIEEIEQAKRDVAVGPLRLNLRVDRVDRVRTQQGREGLLLIDYKTSPHRPGKWTGDRPDQPQLPLYAAVMDSDELLGIAFANVTPGDRDFGLKGLGNDEDIFGQRNTIVLNDQLPVWQQVLETLADGFASGSTEVNPKHPAATCMYCEQRILCRINSLRITSALPDEAEEAE